MIALKLILQSLAVVGAVASFVGGGVLITKNINSSEKNDFYLVSRNVSGGTDHEKKINNSKLWIDSSSENNKAKTKNYFCKSQNNKKDESCELYSLKADEKTKVISYSKIKSFISQNTEANFEKTESGQELKMENFFLLITSLNFFKYNENLLSNRIDMLIKDKNSVTENILVDLNIYSKISTTKNFGLPSILIAKAENLSETIFPITTARNNYKCLFNNEEKPINCEIQLIGTEPRDQNPESLSFETYEQTEEKDNITIKPNSYYSILLFEGFKLSDLNNKKQILAKDSDAVNSQKVKFLIKSAAFLNGNEQGLKNVFIF